MSIIVDPNNASVMYAGIEFNGIYKSIDGGSTWTKLTSGLPSSTATYYRPELGMSKANSSIVYLVNYDGTTCTVYKSADAGSTWAPTAVRLRQIVTV